MTADSGKGPSPHDGGVITDQAPIVEENGSDILGDRNKGSPSYDFEIPRDIVGLLIGTKGVTIKKLMAESGAYIIIRDHLFSDKHKLCSIEGVFASKQGLLGFQNTVRYIVRIGDVHGLLKNRSPLGGWQILCAILFTRILALFF